MAEQSAQLMFHFVFIVPINGARRAASGIEANDFSRRRMGRQAVGHRTRSQSIVSDNPIIRRSIITDASPEQRRPETPSIRGISLIEIMKATTAIDSADVIVDCQARPDIHPVRRCSHPVRRSSHPGCCLRSRERRCNLRKSIKGDEAILLDDVIVPIC